MDHIIIVLYCMLWIKRHYKCPSTWNFQTNNLCICGTNAWCQTAIVMLTMLVTNPDESEKHGHGKSFALKMLMNWLTKLIPVENQMLCWTMLSGNLSLIAIAIVNGKSSCTICPTVPCYSWKNSFRSLMPLYVLLRYTFKLDKLGIIFST